MSEFDFNDELEFPEEPVEAPDEETVVPPKRKKRKGRKVVYYLLIAVFLGVFIYCAVYIANYASEAVQSTTDYNELAALVNGAKDNGDDDPDSTVPQGGSISNGGEAGTADESKILEKYREVYAINNDLVGWINIPGTVIDYPVVQSSINNKDYYLYRNFKGYWSDAGCIYAREACNVFTPSDNVVLYGHHMKYGGMFAGLDAYKNKSFWQEHQYFTFDTIYEEHTYQIIAVFKTSANLGQGFAYHTFNDAASEEEFNDFIKTVHSLQMYNTGLTAEYGDMLLTLSTCEYTLDNGRFVVVAKRVS